MMQQARAGGMTRDGRRDRPAPAPRSPATWTSSSRTPAKLAGRSGHRTRRARCYRPRLLERGAARAGTRGLAQQAQTHVAEQGQPSSLDSEDSQEDFHCRSASHDRARSSRALLPVSRAPLRSYGGLTPRDGRAGAMRKARQSDTRGGKIDPAGPKAPSWLGPILRAWTGHLSCLSCF